MLHACSTWSRALACAAAVGLGLAVGAGCDDRDAETAMVMQPGQTAPTRPEQRPEEPAEPEIANAAPVYISIDGEPYEFPPAKLWLKRSGNRVRAQLFSDDPPEAIRRNWSGDSFYFEMDMELPADEETGGTRSVAGEVTASELAAAEWIFRSDTSDRTDTPSGIFLGGKSHLQPISVSVLFDPLDERTVMVTLEGLFAEFDQARPADRTARRRVRVQAALPADALRP